MVTTKSTTIKKETDIFFEKEDIKTLNKAFNDFLENGTEVHVELEDSKGNVVIVTAFAE